MTRDQASQILAELAPRIAGTRLSAELRQLQELISAPHFPTTAARTLVEKLMRHSSKQVRTLLYNALTPKADRLTVKNRHRMKKKNTLAKVTHKNAGAPWQGGAPGLGKRS